jgi:sodium transport system ATP-binding protein
MARGKIVACGTLEDLRQMYKQDDLEELFFALVS